MNNKGKLYIGVDGGGTKTAIVATDGCGRVVAESLCGPLNYNFIGMEDAVSNLKEGIASLGLSGREIAAVGIGDPSIDDTPDSGNAKIFLEKCREMLSVPVFIRSDVYMTLFALTEGKSSGVLVISGTGSMAMGEDEKGKTHIAGGWGRLSDDEGSGYYIGISGIRAALRCADGIAEHTELLAAALDYFDKNTPRELTEAFYGETEPDIAGFSKRVGECADKGDRVSYEILMSAARYLADYVSVLLKKCNTSRVGVYGSVLVKNKTVRGEFERLLKERNAEITVEEPALNAQTAAALYAKMSFEKGI